MSIIEVWQVDDSGNNMVPTLYNFRDSSQGVDTAINYYVQTLKVKDCIEPIKVFAKDSYYPNDIYCFKIVAKLAVKYCKPCD